MHFHVVDGLALAEVGVVGGGEDAAAVATEQALEVAVVDVVEEHLRQPVVEGDRGVSDSTFRVNRAPPCERDDGSK